MPSVEENRRMYDQAHAWAKQGDEWAEMAAHCGQRYEAWKAALIDAYLLPYLGPGRDIVEIAPGHGRWTEEMVNLSRSVTLVDISPSCLEACRVRFADADNVSYHLGDGESLSFLPDESIDFIWSFDSFVHMELPVIDAYLGEFARVLRPLGRFVIHHAGKRAWSLHFVPVTRRLGKPGRAVQRLASQGRLRDSGWRANVSAVDIARAVARHGLVVEKQTQRWGDRGQFSVEKYRDYITVGVKRGVPQ